jgi:hypothetical protein
VALGLILGGAFLLLVVGRLRFQRGPRPPR